MENKKHYLSIALIIALSVTFVLAAHTITPETFDVNETIQSTYNITVSNTDAGEDANITQVNITIPGNFAFTADTNGTNVTVSTFENTSTILSWTNSTPYLVNGSSANYFWFNATATPGSYNFTITTVNGTGSYASNISITVNDTTNPTASLGTSPPDNYNSSSSNVTFDMKGSDAYSIEALQLWGNWSGSWAANYSNAAITNDTFMNISVNIPEGTYVWGIFVNDSTGNDGWTANRTLTVDTTAPTASASCTPSTVASSSVVTCSCSGTDAASGVASSSTNTSTTTGTLGTYFYTCNVTDYAGHATTSTASYIVIGRQSESSGTTTTSFWTQGTHAVTDKQFEESFTKELQVRQRFRVSVDSVDHYVGVVELTATTVTINVTSDPQQVTLVVGDEKMFEVSGDGYYDILVILNSIEDNKANVTVQSVYELITEDTIGDGDGLDAGETTEEDSKNIWWIGGIIAVILVIVGILYGKRKLR